MAPVRIYAEGIVGDSFTAASIRAQIAEGEPIELHVNSPGGVVAEALAIFNALEDHDGEVVVMVDGVAASAASLLAMAGDKIVMKAGAILMVHNPAGVAIGNADAMRKTAEVLDKIRDRAATIYAARSGLSVGKVVALMSAETWMSGAEAVALGFADQAVEDEAAEPDMSFDFRKFRNPPAALAAKAAMIFKEENVPTTTKKPGADPAAPSTDTAAGAYRQIAEMCFDAKMTAEETVAIIEGSALDVARAKDLVMEAKAKRDPDPVVRPGGGETLADPEFLGQAIERAIYARMTGKPAEGPATELAGRSLLDLGAMVLQARGEKVKSWSRDRLAAQVMMQGGQHSTSDFPFLVGSAGRRILLDSYGVAASPLKQICRVRTATDFRTIAVGRLGEMPELLEVPEGAEVHYGSRTEASESFRLLTYARIFAITRQALVNDDLGAFADSARAWGVAAANVEADQIAALIRGGGAVMADNKTLFHADHGNVNSGDGSAINAVSLTEARQSLREIKGLDNKTPLNLPARYLIVSPAQETIGETVITSIQPTRVEDVNVFADALELLVEPRLADGEWFVAADPARAEVLTIAYLNDVGGPLLEQRDGWTVLGVEFRAVLDFGAGISGYRGIFRNSGVISTET